MSDVKIIAFNNGMQVIANVVREDATHLHVEDMLVIVLIPPQAIKDEDGNVTGKSQPRLQFAEFSDFMVLSDFGDGVAGKVPHTSYMLLSDPVDTIAAGFSSRTSRIQLASVSNSGKIITK
jgi:hypothetical protein